MNLISDAWLPVIRTSGKKDKIVPWQVAERNDPVVELNAPRPDFQGALYQFLIGLLQTCYAPADPDEWLEYWENPPDEEVLLTKFLGIASAFELDNPTGPAFMQDFAGLKGLLDIVKFSGKKPKKDAECFSPVNALLIDAPKDNTLTENKDLFIKRDMVTRLCASCAATALFTLQINAPSGGVGHRVSLRGGGPLTSLVRPSDEALLWQKIWLNVLDEESLVKSIRIPTSDLFPWLAATRVSDKGGRNTRPEDVHLLQMFWGTPRRIRLCFEPSQHQCCDICDGHDGPFVERYITQNYGVKYAGGWVHSLSGYFFDGKKEKPPISVKGQKGGLGYRHWINLVLAHSDDAACAAKVATAYMDQRARDIGSQRIARLWCFGYDMDNMKARCWYDHTLPFFHLDAAQRENVLSWGGDLINAAWDVAGNLRMQVKAAWFSRPGDVKGDMSAVVREFWQQSEADFYKLLERLISLPGDQRLAPPEIYDAWANRLRWLAYDLFDTWALEAPAEDLNMKRIIAARQGLTKKLNGSKPMKELITRANMGKGVKNAANTQISLP